LVLGVFTLGDAPALRGRLGIMSLGVAAGVVAAVTGHAVAGTTVAVISLAPALVLARSCSVLPVECLRLRNVFTASS
jgi:hypothetical protein